MQGHPAGVAGSGSLISGRRVEVSDRQHQRFEVEGVPSCERRLKTGKSQFVQNLAVFCRENCRRSVRRSSKSEGGSRNPPLRIGQAADYAFGYNPPYGLPLLAKRTVAAIPRSRRKGDT